MAILGYYLDVATDVAFTSFVAGYNNLNVGLVTTYPVSGLSSGTTYYYRVRAYDVNGTSVSSNTITVTTQRAITSSSGANGTISPLGATGVTSGNNQSFTITANPTYYILDVLVDGVSVGPVSAYTFTNVIADHTISVTFDNHFIPGGGGGGGTLNASSTGKAAERNARDIGGLVTLLKLHEAVQEMGKAERGN